MDGCDRITVPFVAPFVSPPLLELGTRLLPFPCLKADLPFRCFWARCCHRERAA